MTPYPMSLDAASPADMESRRQRTIDRLTDAFASGAITMDEYERRAAAASAASLPAALDDLTLDLPAIRSASAPRADDGPAAPAYRPTGRSTDMVGMAPQIIGCIMGDRHHTGNWLTSDRVTSFTVMGSTKLDLRDSDLPPGPVRIEVFTLMGDTKIIVPRNLPVRMNDFAFMGESKAARDVNQQIRGAETWVEVSGFVMMGSVDVRAMD